jgi:hypothetical protein
MMYDSEHLFICLFSKCTFSFAYFPIGLFVFLLGFKNSLYILDSALYQTQFYKVFSQSVAYLFILLSVAFTKQKILI